MTKRNFLLDVTIFVVFLITGITGYFLWLLIPHQLDAIFIGLSRNAWVTVHILFGLVGLAGVVVHIIRHWSWLKALRGRTISGLPGKLRANRVVDRIMWFTLIATNLFGTLVWAFNPGGGLYIVMLPDRMHVIFGVACTILMIVHLTLHRKWITSITRRYVHVNLRGIKDFQRQENI
jgi:hypothetical protein